MADIPRIVDEIRGFLLSYDQTMKPRLAELAQEYCDACVEANRRLARCQRLLQQDLRSEALHLARETPDLLDMIRTLEFPERATWIERAGDYNIAVPPAFDVTAYDFLQTAYSEDDPLKELLRVHRRLAVGRAPLKQRLEVLRKLSVADANSAIWSTDIMVFESARIEQLHGEAAEACRSRQIVPLNSLNEELSAKVWSVPPPRAMVQSVKLALSKVRDEQWLDSMRQLVIGLQDAFAAVDVDEARELRKLWKQLQKDSGKSGENPLFEQVRPVFQWLEQEDADEKRESQYHHALSELAEEVEEGDSLGELHRLRDAVLAFAPELPNEMKERVEARARTLGQSAARRRQLVIAASLSAIVVVSACGWWYVRGQTRASAAVKAVAAIEASTGAGRFDEARKALDRLAKDLPDQVRNPAVAAASARLRQDEGVEAARTDRFDEAFKTADASPIDEVEPPAIVAAAWLAQTDAEKARMINLMSRREVARKTKLAGHKREALPKLKALDAKVEEIAATLADEVKDATTAARLGEAQSEHANLAAEVKHSGEEARKLHEATGERLKEFDAKLSLRNAARSVEKILAHGAEGLPGDPGGYEQALKDAIAKAPKGHAADLKIVLGERLFWSDALVWSQVGTRWRVSEANAGRETVAKARAAESETLLNDHSRIPDHELVARAKKHYESIALRTLGSNNLGKQVVLRLSKPTIENVFVTKVREAGSELAYYSKKPRNPDSQVLNPFLSFDVTNAKPRVIGPAGVVEGESGQSLLAKKLKAELDADPSLESWDKLMLSLTRKAAEDPFTDAILRLGMLKDLTRIARDGSAELDVAMELVGRALDDANVDDNLAWMDPHNPAANSARPRAEKAITKLPRWKMVEDEAAEARRKFAADLAAIPTPVGRLAQGKTKRWEFRAIHAAKLPAGPVDLVVVVPSKTRGEWWVIGEAEPGESPRIVAPAPGAMIEGRLVFARPKP